MTAAKLTLPPPGAWESIEYPLDLERGRAELAGLSLSQIADLPFSALAQFSARGRWPAHYPADRCTFYSPHDRYLHVVEAWVHMQVNPVAGSLEKNMYGFDDPLLASVVRYWCDQPKVLVTVNLDSSQLGGRHESEIMGLFLHGVAGNSVAVGSIGHPGPPAVHRDPLTAPEQPAPGSFTPTPAPGQVAASQGVYGPEVASGRSERGAISHLKLDVVNRTLRSSGSTNQSEGGEEKQDNELTVDTNPVMAAQASVIVALNHRIMQGQMAARAAAGKGA